MATVQNARKIGQELRKTMSICLFVFFFNIFVYLSCHPDCTATVQNARKIGQELRKTMRRKGSSQGSLPASRDTLAKSNKSSVEVSSLQVVSFFLFSL